MFKKIKNLVLENILEEQENWVLWVPVFLGLGAYTYFITRENISIFATATLFSVTLFSLLILIKLKRNIILSLPPLIFALGMLWANIFTLCKYSPSINEPIKNQYIFGKIEKVSFYNKYNISQRVVVDVFKIEDLEKSETPKKIRLNVRSENLIAKAGDIVKFKAALSPLPKPVYPNSYDFAEKAYFEQIGATGYLVGNFEIIKSDGHKIQDSINNLRNIIAEKISTSIPQPSAGVAIALLVGERGLIEQEHLRNMQYSGLAHLIAISGLHMALITALFFVFIRYLLSRNEKITLRYNIKKISAIVALIAGFFYLVITGMPVSAKRAYVMIALLFSAILVDREATPIRSLSFAGIIIILLSPYLVTSPSFQMSFSAVLGLITGFGMLSQYGINLYGGTKLTKFLFYLLGILIGSVIAELFISPISIYYFNNYSPYNMIANLVAMPLTTFLIMPMGILSFPLMLIGLEKIALIPMGLDIDIILKMSSEIVSWDNSVFIISQLPPISMFFLFLGGIWICLWKRKWRFCGIAPILIGIIFITLNKNPDVIIDGDGKFFAIYNRQNKQLYFSKEPRSDFKKEIIMKENGQKEFALVQDLESFSSEDADTNFKFKCYNNFCFYKQSNAGIYFITKSYGLEKIKFSENSIITDITYKGVNLDDSDCENCRIINKSDLKKYGTTLLYFDKKNIKIETTF